jgi:predicted metal-binding membrane protein
MTNTLADPARGRQVALGASVAAVAAVCWLIAARRMSGMDMGPGTDLGSLSFFTATWATMMAAMMLPSALPAVLSSGARRPRSVLFLVGYLAAWTLAGVVAFFAYRAVRAEHFGFLGWQRDGAYVAGAAVVAAGLYELAPLKRACLQRCRTSAERGTGRAGRDGLRYAVDCLGCSAGLMLVLFAVGVMSVLWMAVVAALVFVQKVPAWGARVVAPLAVALLGLGVWVALAPSSVPGLTLPM